MIELYTASTFNGQRISIMLEETGVEYSAHWVDLANGEQRQPEYLRLNPQGKIPLIVDHENSTDKPLVLSQSVAILSYLAEKTGQLLPKLLAEKAKVYQWMQFHAVDIGSTIFNAFYLQKLSSERQPDAAKILRDQAYSLYRFIDQQLADNEFIAGSTHSIADITVIPSVMSSEKKLSYFPNLKRWLNQLKQRSAVQRGMAVPLKENDHEN